MTISWLWWTPLGVVEWRFIWPTGQVIDYRTNEEARKRWHSKQQ